MAGNLDDILNDALNDFDFEEETKSAVKLNPESPAGLAPKTDQQKAASSAIPKMPSPAPSSSSADSEPDPKWVDEFLSKMLDSEDGDIQTLIKELSETMGKTSDPLSTADSSPSSSVPLPEMPDLDMNSPELKQTLAALQQMVKDAEDGNVTDDMLDKLLDASGMSNMMKELMSKDVLLEPFKDMEAQYVAWLKENGDKISGEEREKYGKQHQLVQKIIRIYEEEGDGAVEMVSQLVADMQALGDPPQGMLQDMLPGLKFGDDGKPIFPS